MVSTTITGVPFTGTSVARRVSSSLGYRGGHSCPLPGDARAEPSIFGHHNRAHNDAIQRQGAEMGVIIDVLSESQTGAEYPIQYVQSLTTQPDGARFG